MRLPILKPILVLLPLVIFPSCYEIEQKFSHKDPDSVVRQQEDARQVAISARLALAFVEHDFSMQSVNSITPYALQITNLKEGPATGLSSAWAGNTEFGFLGGSFPGIGGTCQNTLDGLASCLMMVTFRPTSVTTYASSLTLNYKGYVGAAATSINFRGAGANIATIRSEDSAAPGSRLSNLGTFIQSGTPLSKTFQITHFGAFAAIGVAFTLESSSSYISNNTCPEIVNGPCSITVTQSVATPGVFSGILRIIYNNGSFVATDVRDITTTVLAAMVPVVPATLAISSADFGRILKDTSSNLAVTVTRSGTLPAIVNAASFSMGSAFSFTGGTYPGTGGSCPALGQVMNTSSCTLGLKYQSVATNSHTDTLTLAFNNGTGSGNNGIYSGGSVAGRGGNEALLAVDISPSGDFGTVSVGRPISKTFTVRNPNLSVMAQSISVSAVAAPFSRSTSCSSTLNGNSACSITVTYTPSAAVATDQFITISFNDGNSTESTQLEVFGTGTRSPTLFISNVSFGSVILNNTTNSSATVTYYGLDPAYQVGVSSLAAPFSYRGGGAFPGTSGTCTGTVSATCTIWFAFSPLAAVAATATNVFSYSATDGGAAVNANFTLSGTGVNPGNLIIQQGAAYDFSDQAYNSNTDVMLTLQNNGSSTVSSISASGLSAPITFRGGSYPGSSGNCGGSLGAGGTCSLFIRFSPTPTLVGSTPTLTISYFNGSVSTSLTFNFSGTSHPEGALSVSGVNFGDLPVGDVSGASSLTVTNTGTATVTNVTVPPVAAPFTVFAAGCLGTLAVGDSCTVQYIFSPTAPGVSTQSLPVTYLDGATLKTAYGSLSGGGTMATQIAANGEHTCWKNRYQQAYCWGHNNVAQLGQDDLNDRGAGGGVNTIPPINLGAGRYVKKIAAGFYHNCAILDNDQVKCWGGNTAGQLGVGSTATTIGGAPNQMSVLPAVNFGTGLYAVDIVAGFAHNCARLNDDTVKCWGLNSQGQLGLGDTQNRGTSASHMGNNLPAVDLGAPVVSLSVGASDTCAVLSTGALKCWGDNFYAQLGLGDWNHRGDDPNDMGSNLPVVEFEDASPISLLASGGAFRIAVFGNGTVAGIGRNDVSGNLGKALCQSAGGIAGLCGGQYTFDLPAYGRSASHRLGDSLSVINLGSTPVAEVVAGNTHACVRFTDNKTKCWGENAKGQLGIGSKLSVGAGASSMGTNLVETMLSSTLKAKALSSASFHVCAILTNGVLKCWGDNRFGQLGVPNAGNAALGDVPGEMGDALPIVSVP